MAPANFADSFARSALIVVDMQNDFLHGDGSFAHRAREHPEANIDLPFLIGTIPAMQNGCWTRSGPPASRWCMSPTC